MSNSRREFIACSLGIGAGALLASCGTKNIGLLEPTPVRAADVTYPWPYDALDPKAAAQRGYDIFWDRHCMAGPFEAIVAELGATRGEPYSSFPFEMMKAGAGGLAVSSACGTVNGSAMAIGLFVSDGAARGALINDLFHWYEQTMLPDFVPTVPKNDVEIAKSIATSNLCHVSVSNWCDVSTHSAYSAERSERCARLVGSVTEKLVEMLNAHFAGTFAPAYPLSEESLSCRGCHDKGGMLENTRANMDCMSCHEPH